MVRMIHPRTFDRAGTIEPIYAVPGVPSARISQAVRSVGLFPEVHAPTSLESHLAAREELRRELARAEAAWLIARRLEREQALDRVRAPRLDRAGALKFPFDLTAAQTRAIATIDTQRAGRPAAGAFGRCAKVVIVRAARAADRSGKPVCAGALGARNFP